MAGLKVTKVSPVHLRKGLHASSQILVGVGGWVGVRVVVADELSRTFLLPMLYLEEENIDGV